MVDVYHAAADTGRSPCPWLAGSDCAASRAQDFEIGRSTPAPANSRLADTASRRLDADTSRGSNRARKNRDDSRRYGDHAVTLMVKWVALATVASLAFRVVAGV